MKLFCKQLFLGALLLVSSLITSTVYSELAPALSTNLNGASQNFSAMLKKVMPAVVNITVQGQLPDLPYYLEPNMPENQPPTNSNHEKGPKFIDVGSGVVVDAAKGYIVTNAHVIRDAETIVVTLSDGRRLRAKKIGEDKDTDIAVIQVKAPNLTAIPFGNSNTIKVGDFVAAIGNAFGLNQTVTSGVVSAQHRAMGIENYEDFIQTDAPINPGNSGGALVNMQGQLVGMNTAILAPMGGNVGIGFAIPENMIRNIMNQLIKDGKVKRGLLGVLVQDFTPNLADAFNMTGVAGVIVTQVNPGSSAAKAGLTADDVIEKLNGEPLYNMAQLRSMIGSFPAGTKITLTVRRQDKTFTVTPVITSPQQQVATEEDRLHFLTGVSLRDYDMFSPAIGEVKGVQAIRVDDTSDAWLGGLRPGDVILSANSKPTQNIDTLLNIASQNKQQLLLKIWRSGGTLYLVIS